MFDQSCSFIADSQVKPKGGRTWHLNFLKTSLEVLLLQKEV
jgi:hypothetical protein